MAHFKGGGAAHVASFDDERGAVADGAMLGGEESSALDLSAMSVAPPKARGFNLKRDAEHMGFKGGFDIERHVRGVYDMACVRLLDA